MPRRRIPTISIPSRPDHRRGRGNATDAQRPSRRGRPGETEKIAERRVRAFERRKQGCAYREIARELHVDVHTIYGDVQAELASLRETAVGEATQLRALELERLDGMTSGLWPHARAGSAPAVTAAVKVSERRARLLGLDIVVELSGNEATPLYKAVRHGDTIQVRRVLRRAQIRTSQSGVSARSSRRLQFEATHRSYGCC